MTPNIVSSVATLCTLRRMTRYQATLAEYVMARRGLLGITLTELASRAGLSKSELSAIETGKVKLPGADKRRRLAQALGGFHAELLVNAGEITPEEIVEGANAYDPKHLEASMPFPPGTDAAELVEILKHLPERETRQLLETAKTYRDWARADGSVRPIGHRAKRQAG